MVLVSLKSSETDNGYDFSNNFPEALVIDPNATVSVVNLMFERENNFEVNTSNNWFQVRVGDESTAIVNLGIAIGNYTGQELSKAIQNAFNYRFIDEGWIINVSYADDAFTIQSLSIPSGLVLSLSAAQDEPDTPATELGAYDPDTGTLPTSAITDGTANYSFSKGKVETLESFPIGKSGNGPISMVAKLNTLPPNAVVGASYGYGFTMALVLEGSALDYQNGVKEVSDPANISDGALITMCLYRKPTTNTLWIDLFNGKTLIAHISATVITDGTSFQVGCDAENFFCRYQLEDTNDWVKLPITNPSLTFNNIQDLNVLTLVGQDYQGVSITDIQYTADGQIQMSNNNFTPRLEVGSTTFTPTGADSGVGEIKRTLYNGGVYNNNDAGVLSQLLLANQSSELDFQVNNRYKDNVSVSFGIIDEGQRLLNVDAGANLGNANYLTSVSADPQGADIPAPNKNPYLVQYTINTGYGVKRRLYQNTNTVADTVVLTHADCLSAPNLVFRLRVDAPSNVAILAYKLDADSATSPWVSLTPLELPVYNGSKTPDNISGYGTSLSRSGDGYAYTLNCPTWFGTEATPQQFITNVGIRTAEGPADALVQLFPLPVGSVFGRLIGFEKEVYSFQEGLSQTGSTPNPQAGAGSSYDDMIQFNIPTLGIRSLTGQKYKKDATLADKPIGSLGGISRMIAQVPRSRDPATATNLGFGPFFYNYFPYSVPLKNATELNLNELQITVTNRNGTLAKDIKSADILLNITQVESFGQSKYEPQIGPPITMYQSHSQQNILNSQMPATID